MSNTVIRSALRETFGARNYRISEDGEIHVRGMMPNTNAVGWYLYGYVDDAQTLERLSAGKEPAPDEIRAGRERAKLSREAAASLIYKSVRAWEKWETGERAMDAAFWELWRIKAGQFR